MGFNTKITKITKTTKVIMGLNHRDHRTVEITEDFIGHNNRNLGDLGGTWRLGGYVLRVTFHVLRTRDYGVTT